MSDEQAFQTHEVARLLQQMVERIGEVNVSIKELHTDMRDVRERLVAIEAKDLASRMAILESERSRDALQLQRDLATHTLDRTNAESALDKRISDLQNKIVPILFVGAIVVSLGIEKIFGNLFP